MIHHTQLTPEIKEITYKRNPTKEEIKFGHGAIHYRDFEIENCINEKGYLKETLRANDDKLNYKRC
jgi:hypothetical protein